MFHYSLCLLPWFVYDAIYYFCCFFFFFFKQKTAYEMRISDWSSDVCSSDLSIAFANRDNHCHFPNAIEASKIYHDAIVANRFLDPEDRKIGRASCRERVCQYV